LYQPTAQASVADSALTLTSRLEVELGLGVRTGGGSGKDVVACPVALGSVVREIAVNTATDIAMLRCTVDGVPLRAASASSLS
jgi:hypothetical protein